MSGMHDDPAAPQAVTGIRALFAVRAAMLGWYVVWSLVLHLGRSSAALRDDHWWKLGTLVWTILDLALVIVAVPFARGRRGGDAEVAALAFAVLAGIGFSTSALR